MKIPVLHPWVVALVAWLCAVATTFAQGPADPALWDPVTPQGQQARGLYYSGMRVRYLGPDKIARELKRAGLTAAVIDLKDGQGQVTYRTGIAVLKPQVEPYIEDVAALVENLRAQGVYTIARIVCFTDPSLPTREPSRAVMDGRAGHEGQPWAKWAGRNTWLDPFNEDNHRLVVELAREAAGFGFDEIQFDYFRFPVDRATSFAVFPSDKGKPRHLVLAGLLEQVDRAIDIPIGVDVFGVTAFPFYRPQGLGQLVEHWLPYVEVLSPMLYVNGMGGWMPDVEERRAERLIRVGVGHMRDKLGAGVVIRPFLQAFKAGADYFDERFIAEQVRAVASRGGDGFLFWHPNSDYKLVRRALRAPGARVPAFPVERRREARRLAMASSAQLPAVPPTPRATPQPVARPAVLADTGSAVLSTAPLAACGRSASPAVGAANVSDDAKGCGSVEPIVRRRRRGLAAAFRPRGIRRPAAAATLVCRQ